MVQGYLLEDHITYKWIKGSSWNCQDLSRFSAKCSLFGNDYKLSPLVASVKGGEQLGGGREGREGQSHRAYPAVASIKFFGVFHVLSLISLWIMHSTPLYVLFVLIWKWSTVLLGIDVGRNTPLCRVTQSQFGKSSPDGKAHTGNQQKFLCCISF